MSHAAPILVDSLRKMEYRGYDSVGIATVTGGNILVRKGVGKVVEVEEKRFKRERFLVGY